VDKNTARNNEGQNQYITTHNQRRKTMKDSKRARKTKANAKPYTGVSKYAKKVKAEATAEAEVGAKALASFHVLAKLLNENA
jgi:hypothetical protein